MDSAVYGDVNQVEQDHWWFIARRKQIQILLDSVFSAHRIKKEELRLLDLGCGTGATLAYYKSQGFNVSGLDNSEEAIEFCHQKGLDHVIKGDATHLPFESQTFDVVLALDVLEHFDDDYAAMKEIARILKPGGICIATVPAHEWMWSYYDDSVHHRRRYSRRGFSDLMKCHLEPQSIGWIHCSILVPIFIIRRLKRLFRVEKKHSDLKQAPVWLNRLIKWYYAVEYVLFKHFYSLPFGTSLISLSKK